MPKYLGQHALAAALGLSVTALRRQQQHPTTLQERGYQLAHAALLAGLPPCPVLTKEQLQAIFAGMQVSARTLRRYRTRDLDDLLAARWFALAAQACLHKLDPVAFEPQRDRTRRLRGSLIVPAGAFPNKPKRKPRAKKLRTFVRPDGTRYYE